MQNRFPAFIIDEVEGKHHAGLGELTLADLPAHEVLVEISHSSLNYKDGLAISGKARIARRLPMVAGIDLAGRVVASESPLWRPGDQVIVNGWGLSETEWGGYSRFQRLRPEHLSPLPDNLTPFEAMAIGTAGFTAALCVLALEDYGLLPPTAAPSGQFVVTGAMGGVGTIAIALLAARGAHVIASTGRPDEEAFLKSLGASAVMARDTLNQSDKMLQAERWAGGIDCLGGQSLANLLAQTCYGGAIAACGLAQSATLPASVMPHILRAVALLGVDSVMCPSPKRARAWQLLARDLDRAKLHALTTSAKLSDLPHLAPTILAGEIRGRVVIEIG